MIHLKWGTERKQPHIYKVIETLRPKVLKQIIELLEKDLTEAFLPEIAYPLVCVTKKDGTIRLCADYRDITIPDAELEQFKVKGWKSKVSDNSEPLERIFGNTVRNK